MSEMLRNYLKNCREEWMPVDYLGNRPLSENWQTKWKVKTEYRIVFDNYKFVSLGADEWSHEDSNCSNAKISVGTLRRSTGKRIHLADLYGNFAEKAMLEKAWNALVESEGTRNMLIIDGLGDEARRGRTQSVQSLPVSHSLVSKQRLSPTPKKYLSKPEKRLESL